MPIQQSIEFTQRDPLTLLSMPEDALMIVLNKLDTKSLCSLCMTCRQMKVVAGADMLWRNLFQARWRWRPSTWALAAVLPWSSPLAQTIEGPPQRGWQAAFAERFTQQNRPPQISTTPDLPGNPDVAIAASEGDEDINLGEADLDDTHVPSHPGRRRLSWSRSRSRSPSPMANTANAFGVPRVPRTVLVNRAGMDAPASVIQAALDGCQAGDVVLLTPATYTGAVTLPPGVELRGNGPRGTVLIVSDEEPAVSFDPEATPRRDGNGGDDATNDANNTATTAAAAATPLAGALEGLVGGTNVGGTLLEDGQLQGQGADGEGAGEEDLEVDLPIPPGLVTNVTLWRQSASSSGTLAGGPPVSCVLVRGGALRLDSCNVVSAGEGVVAEPGARALISACDISAVLSGFVGSAGELCSSVVSTAQTDAGPQDALFAAVTVLAGSVTVVNNRIVYGTAHGVAVLDGGSGLIKDNLIASNAGAGVCIGTVSDPHLEGNLIADNGGQGLAIYNGGQGRVVSCEIRSNAYNGVDISLNRTHPAPADEELPCPRIDSCHIHDNSKDGVNISGGANCMIHECDIFDNKEHGVTVQAASRANIEHSRFNGSRGHGLNIKGAGTTPAVFNCKIGTHGRDNIAVSDWAMPLFLACEIAGSPAAGMSFAGGAAGTIRGCNIHGNGGPAVMAAGWGAPVIEWSHIHGGRGDGVVFAEGTKGIMRHCKVRKNKGAGIWIKSNSVPKVSHNHVSRNGKGGVVLGDTGEGCVHVTTDSRWHEPTEAESPSVRRERRLRRWNGRREEPAARQLYSDAAAPEHHRYDDAQVDSNLVRGLFEGVADDDGDDANNFGDHVGASRGGVGQDRGDDGTESSGSGPDENGSDEEDSSDDEGEEAAVAAAEAVGREQGPMTPVRGNGSGGIGEGSGAHTPGGGNRWALRQRRPPQLQVGGGGEPAGNQMHLPPSPAAPTRRGAQYRWTRDEPLP